MAKGPKLQVGVGANVDDFEKKFERVKKTADRQLGNVEKRGKKFARTFEKDIGGGVSKAGGLLANFGKGLVGGIFAGGAAGFYASARNAANSIAQIGDEARRAGLSFKAFQELKYVAEQNRIGVDSLVDGIKELNLRADEFITTGKGSAAEAFGRLGYSAEQLRDKLRDPSALFTEIIGKLEKLDKAAAIRIADEIFGGTGGEKFVQLIAQGEKGIRDTIRAANDLGIVMDDDIIKKADELDRKFQAITSTVSSGLKTAIVEAAAALQGFLDRFRQVEARQTATLQTQLKEAERNLKAAQEAEGRLGGLLDSAVRKQIDHSQKEVDYLRNVLRDRTLETIRPQLESMNSGGVAPKGDRLGYTPPVTDTSGTRTKNAAATRTERDAVKELLADLEFERSLVGQSALEKEKMVALRHAGVTAASAEGQAISQAVEALWRESEAWDAVEQRMLEVNDIAREVTGGIISGLLEGKDAADIFSDALKRIGDRLLNMGLDALFGGAGGGLGFIGKLFGFADGGGIDINRHAPRLVKLASGGGVRGPGGPKGDKIPAMLSDGEFVVNAAATRKHRAMLEAINDGKIRGLANGGYVPSGEAGAELIIMRAAA